MLASLGRHRSGKYFVICATSWNLVCSWVCVLTVVSSRAPEIHNISGKWYIIFTATPDGDNPPPLQDAICPINCPAVNHRMFVLESSGSDPWTSDFPMKSMLNTYDQFAIDGTYFSYKDKLYHIYSCWENAYSAWPANLCITEMSDPWTVVSSLGQRQMVSPVMRNVGQCPKK